MFKCLRPLILLYLFFFFFSILWEDGIIDDTERLCMNTVHSWRADIAVWGLSIAHKSETLFSIAKRFIVLELS